MFFLIFGQFGSFYGHFTVILWSFFGQSDQFACPRPFFKISKFFKIFLNNKIMVCLKNPGRISVFSHFRSVWVILRSVYGHFVVIFRSI